MNNTYKVVIGDWSCDGHNRYDYYYFKCNKTDVEIKKAYKKAVKESGVSLHNDRKVKAKHKILCEYEESRIPADALERLIKLGVNFDKFYSEFDEDQVCGPEEVASLFLEMVRTQLPGFEYKLINDEVKCLNGGSSNDFSYGFGYGVYYS